MIDIAEASDRCVMCGMCLPHCPTYGKTRNEADSPRGRIALIRALNSASLSGDDALISHLNGCLNCRACEAVCPAAVPYGELIDAARASLPPQPPWIIHPARAFTDLFIERRWARRLAFWLLLAYQRAGIGKIARASGLLQIIGLERAESLLPRLESAPIIGTARPSDDERPKVALFTGCVAEIFDRATLQASQRMLVRLGYEVVVPRRQTCCGALHQHAGAPDKAQVLMKRNLEVFDPAEMEVVISTASGCGAQLAEYGQCLGGESAQRFTRRHKDVCQFLGDLEWPRRVGFRPLEAKVAVHAPCSLTHVLKQADYAMKLLARIPKIELFELPGNASCCGAAGSYMLSQPGMADELLADKIEHLKLWRPEILVTSNIGCAMHIGTGLRRAGLAIEVMHPVALLNKQLACA